MAHTQLHSSQEANKRGERLFPGKCERNYWVLSELRRAFEAFIPRYLPAQSGVILDYGCGNMPYRSLFEKEGVEYRGYDFPGNDLAFGCIQEDGSLPVAANIADCVVSSQVLEHVGDVPFYLRESERVLKPGGTLLLSTHGVWRYHPDPTDYWRWTGDGLAKVVSEAGFQVLQMIGIVGPAATGIQIFQDAVSAKIPRRLQKPATCVFQRLMQYFDQRCSEQTKSRDASVFICIATSTK